MSVMLLFCVQIRRVVWVQSAEEDDLVLRVYGGGRGRKGEDQTVTLSQLVGLLSTNSAY